MSEKIIVIDLSSNKISTQSYIVNGDTRYGRGLALELLKEHVPLDAGRFSPDNALVLVPGLFVGNLSPSSCRIMIATAGDRAEGMQICNMTGNTAQKMGSLNIAGIVIKGKAAEPGAVIHIDGNGASVNRRDDLGGLKTSEIIEALKAEYCRDSAIMGIGKAGDMMLPLSSIFCTYPDGEPEYHVPRNGFGDVWGAKNLRAIVIDGDSYFARDCANPGEFAAKGRKLARMIIDDEICGGALPTYGSITIMKILDGRDGMELPSEEPVCRDFSKNEHERIEDGKKVRINRTCAPMCVIGCLNRHAASNGRRYSSPAQVETQAAICNCFGADDYELGNAVQKKASEIGLVATEFVTAANTYARALGIENGQEHLLEWLDEIEEGSPFGRLIASRTHGVKDLYKDKKLDEWLDRGPAEEEDSFDIEMNKAFDGLNELSDLDLLYAQIFVLENLGICIFTSFALLGRRDSFELLAEMFEDRTGIGMDGESLIRQAGDCIERERIYKEERWKAAQKHNIPPFTRVLYRYFGKREEAQDD